MADHEERVKITYDTNADQAAKDANKLAGSLDNVNDAQKKVSKSASETADAVSKNGGAIAILDSLTGGWATTLKDSYEASELFNGGLGKMLKSVKTFSTGAKAALIGTGIGAIVVLVGTLVAYWDDIVGLVSGVNHEMKEQNRIAAENVEEQQKQLDILNSQDNILKLQGKSEREILELKIKQTEETIKALEAQVASQEIIRDAQVKTAQRNKDILSGLLKFVSLPITALLKGIDEIGKAFGKDFNLSSVFEKTANLVFDPEEAAVEGQKEIDETNKKLLGLKNTLAGYKLSVKEIDRKAAEDAAKSRDEANKAELERQKAHNEKMLALLNEKNAKEKALIEELQNFYDVTDQQKLDRLKERADEEVEVLRQKGIDVTNIVRLNEEKFQELQKELDAKDLERQREKFIAEGMAEAEAAAEAKKQQDIIAANRQDNINRLNSMGDSLLKNAAEGVIKNKKIQKAAIITDGAVSIGKTVANTSEAIGKDLAKGFPFNVPLIAFDAATGALSIASIIQGTNKALSALGGGSVSGAGATAGMTAAASPSVAFNNTAENQIGQSVARTQAQQPPIRVFVAESDITESQKNVKAVVDTNTFG